MKAGGIFANCDVGGACREDGYKPLRESQEAAASRRRQFAVQICGIDARLPLMFVGRTQGWKAAAICMLGFGDGVVHR